MNVFGIGLPEMAVIAAIGLLVFGPKRLPELGKTLGRTLRGFQTASQEFEKEFRNAVATSEAEPAELKSQAQVMAPGLQAAAGESTATSPSGDHPPA
ncbi:MAG: TatA/E family twin arginine-targeting protein translocase [Cyanobium sp.]